MTPAQIAKIMALVEEYVGDYARATTENLYGTSKSYTKQCFEAANEARAAVEAALRDAPQQAATIAEARKADDVDRLLHQVFLLCEAVEDAPAIAPQNEHERGFDRGRRFEAKQIRRAIGDWFQWTFCGRSFMGDPVLAAAPTEAKPAQDAVDAAYEACAQIAFDADHMGSVNMKLLKNRIGNAIRAAISAKKGDQS